MADRRLRVIGNLDRFTARVVRRLSLDITANLQENPPEGTPVDTGFARANWIPNIGGPVTTTAGTRADAEAGIINAGASETGKAAVAVGYKSIKQGPVFSSNNVGYIPKLNDGHSKQTPKAFIQRGIKKGIRLLKVRQ